MSAVITNSTVLSDSTNKTRPDFQTILLTDTNAGPNVMKLIEQKRQKRHMKFPSLSGLVEVESFKDKNNKSFRRWDDEGDFRPLGPNRDYTNIVDPVSGFVSAGGDHDRNTGHTKIKSMLNINDTPIATTPRSKNSSRPQCVTAPMQFNRQRSCGPGEPTEWNSRKVSDIWIRSQLGGWTSRKDPRDNDPQPSIQRSKSMYVTKSSSDRSAENSSKDQLALKYRYSTSTQRMYEDVPWDSMLVKKIRPPVSTLEEKPDMISQRWSLKRYDAAPGEWQGLGRSWDWFQKRNANYKDEPIDFCSSCPRVQQIPLYGGCIGAENVEEKDNAQEAFDPFTVKRVDLPRYIETGHRPDIPGYTGSTLYQGEYSPMHSEVILPLQQTTAVTHRILPTSPSKKVAFKKESQMSKMVTTVQPCNPFSQIYKEPVMA